MTLLEAIEICLNENGRTFEDVLWIGCKEFYVDKENFKQLAAKVNDKSAESWNPAYQIPVDLMLVGKDFIITRDPSEPEALDERPKCLQQLRMYQILPRPTEQKELKTLLSSEITHKVYEDRYDGVWGTKMIEYT